MSDGGEPAVLAVRATASEEERPLFRQVSFELPRGQVLAVLGQRAVASALLECLAGRRRLDDGRVQVLGVDPTRRWRLRGRRVYATTGTSSIAKAPELLLLDEPGSLPEELRSWLREKANAGMAATVSTRDADGAASLADRLLLLSRGRVVAEGEVSEVVRRFRRLRFVNRLTETRTVFGSELDEFEAVRVRVRGWGIEAVVANYEEAAFERLRAVDGIADAESETMTLAEIAEACAEGG